MNGYRLYGFAAFIAVIAQFVGTSVLAQTNPWPILQSITEEFVMNLRDPRTLVTMDLRDLVGKSQYQLVCFSGDDTADLQLPYSYTGGLRCGLASTGTLVAEILVEGSLLLAEDEPSAIYSRGNINPPAMVGHCANHPDYGSLRTFSLRGFRLTLKVSEVEVRPDYDGDGSYGIDYRKNFPIGRMKLTVTVAPDPTATNDRALPSTYVDPEDLQEECAEPITEWPVLQSTSKEVSINLHDNRTLITVDLPDPAGKSKYQLVCFSGDDAAYYGLDESILAGFIYSGGLLCGLAPTGTPASYNILGNSSLLISKEEDGAIYSRGVFHPPELVGRCADYSDHGLIRTFSMRGFKLTLKMSDVEVSPDYKGDNAYIENYREDYPIGQMKLTVTVAPDPKARSARALPSKYAYPKGGQEACAEPILVETEK